MNQYVFVRVSAFELIAKLLGSVYQRQLVRRRRIIRSLLLIDDYCVTCCKEDNNTLHCLMIRPLGIQQILLHIQVTEVDVLLLLHGWLLSSAIAFESRRELFEFHDVAG